MSLLEDSEQTTCSFETSAIRLSGVQTVSKNTVEAMVAKWS